MRKEQSFLKQHSLNVFKRDFPSYHLEKKVQHKSKNAPTDRLSTHCEQPRLCLHDLTRETSRAGREGFKIFFSNLSIFEIFQNPFPKKNIFLCQILTDFKKNLEPSLPALLGFRDSRTATGMDETLHTDFQKSETSRDIKKYF